MQTEDENDQKKEIGDWAQRPGAVEMAGYTQSCTDGDMICCSRAALQGFIYTLRNPELAKYIPELLQHGLDAIPEAGTPEALKRLS
ncbi:hypothetical protein [Paraburkholderia dilworthii]|uniref:Uncharacterized protein n=1 Tax=Paraburkholderia dilworthii TaxID=948106 RepID=A0ABW9DAI1_9BURK